ncbi:CLUMA_CG001898, isoform A [Clunio marinus]|uniref:CLUMA_CG001898, isoform A n=1 Tax=Clunio marinus TaxID=568069 RepID=A0A1J1HPH1_9DIPT|nr:CLUMA_CG001898, isoform A [Clunio marinus]
MFNFQLRIILIIELNTTKRQTSLILLKDRKGRQLNSLFNSPSSAHLLACFRLRFTTWNFK